MSSWDTNPWSNFCGPHWELICRNEWHPGTSEIFTSTSNCRDALPCANMALNVPQYFNLLMEKPLGRYFQVWSSYYQPAQCNQKTPIPTVSLGDKHGLRTPKRIGVYTNHSYHQRSLPKASLNWSNNKSWFSYNQSNMKMGYEASRCKTSTP